MFVMMPSELCAILFGVRTFNVRRSRCLYLKNDPHSLTNSDQAQETESP